MTMLLYVTHVVRRSCGIKTHFDVMFPLKMSPKDGSETSGQSHEFDRKLLLKPKYFKMNFNKPAARASNYLLISIHCSTLFVLYVLLLAEL